MAQFSQQFGNHTDTGNQGKEPHADEEQIHDFLKKLPSGQKFDNFAAPLEKVGVCTVGNLREVSDSDLRDVLLKKKVPLPSVRLFITEMRKIVPMPEIFSDYSQSREPAISVTTGPPPLIPLSLEEFSAIASVGSKKKQALERSRLFETQLKQVSVLKKAVEEQIEEFTTDAIAQVMLLKQKLHKFNEEQCVKELNNLYEFKKTLDEYLRLIQDADGECALSQKITDSSLIEDRKNTLLSNAKKVEDLKIPPIPEPLKMFLDKDTESIANLAEITVCRGIFAKLEGVVEDDGVEAKKTAIFGKKNEKRGKEQKKEAKTREVKSEPGGKKESEREEGEKESETEGEREKEKECGKDVEREIGKESLSLEEDSASTTSSNIFLGSK